VHLHVPRLRRDDEWSTVQTTPSTDLLRTCFLPKHIDIVTGQEPPWKIGDQVNLTLTPYGPDRRAMSRPGNGYPRVDCMRSRMPVPRSE